MVVLRGLKRLRVLNLSQNPTAFRSGYRSWVRRCLWYYDPDLAREGFELGASGPLEMRAEGNRRRPEASAQQKQVLEFSLLGRPLP